MLNDLEKQLRDALEECRDAMRADNPADGWLEIMQQADTALAAAKRKESNKHGPVSGQPRRMDKNNSSRQAVDLYRQRIRDLRKRREMTQQQLADRIGLDHHQTIGKIERGEQRLRLDQLPLFADALNIDLWQLLTDEPSPFGLPVHYVHEDDNMKDINAPALDTEAELGVLEEAGEEPVEPPTRKTKGKRKTPAKSQP